MSAGDDTAPPADDELCPHCLYLAHVPGGDWSELTDEGRDDWTRAARSAVRHVDSRGDCIECGHRSHTDLDRCPVVVEEYPIDHRCLRTPCECTGRAGDTAPDDEPLSIYDELEDQSWMDLAGMVGRLRADRAEALDQAWQEGYDANTTDDRLRARVAELEGADRIVTELCDEYGVERGELVDRLGRDRLVMMAFDECVREETAALRDAGDAVVRVLKDLAMEATNFGGADAVELVRRAEPVPAVVQAWRSAAGGER